MSARTIQRGLQAIEWELQYCQRQLGSCPTSDPRLENVLVRHVLVVMCCHFENTIDTLLVDRFAVVSDASVRRYLSSVTPAVRRSLRTGELSGLLGRFGAQHKDEFRSLLDGHDHAEEDYNSIIANRNEVAHKGICNVTLGEVNSYFLRARLVLYCFWNALELSGDTAVSE